MSGGQARGDKHPMAKLTEQQAREIFRLLETGKYPSREISERFGVCESDIDRMRAGKLWKSAQPEGWKKPRLLTKAGEVHSRAILTEKDVRLILKALRRGEMVTMIADRYKVHYTTISNIKTRKTWRHIV